MVILKILRIMKKWSNFMKYKKIHTIAFDFDGVFTNNKVIFDQNGKESVICNRADSLGINLLKSYISINNLDVDFFIISSENNKVVSKRANKMKIKANIGIKNKLEFIERYLIKKLKYEKNIYSGLIYIGNDLNDLPIILKSGISFAPKDAHDLIKKNVTKVFNKKGGDGFVRLVIEHILDLNKLNLKNLEKLINFR